MKKLLFSIFILISINSNAQCDFKLDELIDLVVSNSSEYETKILTKGYDYDSKRDAYFCGTQNGYFRVSKRFKLDEVDKFWALVYLTPSKENYLEIKKRIVDMKFTFKGEMPLENSFGLIYKLNNINLILSAENIDSTPIYHILVQVE